MLKDLLKKLNVEFDENISDEEAKALIEKELDEKEKHITTLESEKDALSKSNQELTTSVEGYKSSQEKLSKELSETKGKLAQVTEMYKEQFSKDSEEQQNVESKKNEELEKDVLDLVVDLK